jgi:succinoglycan biosynthesis protein ExoU
VLIAAKDAAAVIGRAVRSALAEPETAEVLVVDDGSRDDTAAAARAAAAGSARLSVIRLGRNLGPAAARNRALEAASAPLVTVLDADDWLQLGRFARLLDAAAEGWDLVADDLLLAEEGAAEPYAPLLRLDGPPQPVDLERFVLANLPDRRRARQELGYLKPLMRRDLLLRLGLRYDPAVRLGEDYLLYANALARGARFRLVGACGYVAVQRPGSLSRRHGAADLLALARGDEALLALPGLTRSERAALQAHRRATLDKHFHRVALDAKAAGRWGEVARAFFGTPSAARHILMETLHARLGRA